MTLLWLQLIISLHLLDKKRLIIFIFLLHILPYIHFFSLDIVRLTDKLMNPKFSSVTIKNQIIIYHIPNHRFLFFLFSFLPLTTPGGSLN